MKFDIQSLQTFYSNYTKQIKVIFFSTILIIGCVYYYLQFYKAPREAKATEAIFAAQRFFRLDSFDYALNGIGSSKGFNSVIKNYSGTKSGELAKYYAGIIYLKQGAFKKAIECLSSFSSNSNALNGYSTGALADAYSELKDYDKAVDLYKKSANILKDDNVWGAENLLKAAILLEIQHKENEALELYKKLTENFPEAKQKTIAEQSLYRLGYKE